ncbi:14786_t:CDS:2 [Gigaspora margarita]|uniref:14786_t:CDS:1 n=1 Tax=Gigaspora margarita TaxID=4874 RepID=A0ABN7V8D2_GIGMA|nr:14786_t:CDS:2 [Gigaspora margarita]
MSQANQAKKKKKTTSKYIERIENSIRKSVTPTYNPILPNVEEYDTSQMKAYKDNQIANAEDKFNNAKRQYFVAIDNLFMVASASEDFTKAFDVLQRIQNEGDNWTKSQTKNKLAKRLLGGYGCTKNINEARKLIEEASNLDHTHAKAWLNNYRLIDDFGASEVIKHKMT